MRVQKEEASWQVCFVGIIIRRAAGRAETV